jgi:thiamine biosynthesis lipoprotein
MKKHAKIAGLVLGSLIIIFMLLFKGCDAKEVLISGETMGTTYHIKVISGYFKNISVLKRQIFQRLEEINSSMSIYIKKSEISRFNAISNTKEKYYISEDFYNVMVIAEKLHKLTDGAWDGTLKPIITLWGFGGTKKKKNIPGESEIEKHLKNIGFDHIEISKKRYIRKKNPSISLNLNSIAKGYAVDQVAALIRKHQITDFLVEIGGEVFASGSRKDAENWRVGINLPLKDAPYDSVYRIVDLQDKALATSGDYRDYFIINDKHYSHVFDPRTGYPVAHGIVSVSILADTCTFADGLATAAMVLGRVKSLELVNRLDRVECLIVRKGKNGTLIDSYSTGFRLAQQPGKP